MERDVFGLVLGIERQQPDFALPGFPVVNHPQSATLATSLGTPAQLAYTAAARNDRPGLRPERQRPLKRRVFIVVQVTMNQARENRGFNENQGIFGLYGNAV